MEEDLSEIVEACNEMSNEELCEPSLESENAYSGEGEFEPDEEQKAAIDRIVSGE